MQLSIPFLPQVYKIKFMVIDCAKVHAFYYYTFEALLLQLGRKNSLNF